MRSLLISLAAVLLGSGPIACGGASGGGGSASGITHDASTVAASDSHAAKVILAAPLSGDTDHDSSEQTTFDSDDYHSLTFGHAANVADRQAITAIVKRYYVALASEDGATACSLLLTVVAESIAEEAYSQSAPGAAQGKTCAQVTSGLFAESHPQLLAEDHTLRVIGVRVRRKRASALLRFGAKSARHILLYREGSAWKIGTLADEDLG